MIPIQSAAVIGLGLIGGSIARDLAAAGVSVMGADRDRAAVDAAMEEGIVAAAPGPDHRGVEDADAVFLAVPVSEAGTVLREIAPRCGAARVVMDVGSTQRSIVAAAETIGIADRFVGTHPLAGGHRSGWDASRAGLFCAARLFLVPTRSTTDVALSLAHDIWSGLDALPEVMDAREHDQLMAAVSHLPHVASSAAALAIARCGVDRRDLGPGGHAMTRLAGSSPESWSAICLQNADLVGEALDALREELELAADALRRNDRQALARFFGEGHRWFHETK